MTISTTQRPEYFRLNANCPLSQGLVFAGLGRFPGTVDYDDATESIYGQGNRGTLTNMDPATDWVWSDELGRWGVGFDNSSGQYVIVPDSPSIRFGSGDFSIVAWCRNDEEGTRAQAILAKGETSSGEWMFDTGGENLRLYSSSGITDALALDWFQGKYGTWVSVAAVRSGNTCTVYGNGVALSSDDTSSANLNTTDPFTIGSVWDASGASADRYFMGAISDVLLYRRALSLCEIQALADPSSVMLEVGGVPLLLPPRRRSWPVATAGGDPPVVTYKSQVFMVC